MKIIMRLKVKDLWYSKGLVAALKLKSIAQYMNDFKKIIESCRAEIIKAQAKEKKWLNLNNYNITQI